VGAVITQEHDRFLMNSSISKCPVMKNKRPATEIETVDDTESKKPKLLQQDMYPCSEISLPKTEV